YSVLFGAAATGAVTNLRAAGPQAILLRSPALAINGLAVDGAGTALQAETDAGWGEVAIQGFQPTNSSVGLPATGPAPLRLPGAATVVLSVPHRFRLLANGVPSTVAATPYRVAGTSGADATYVDATFAAARTVTLPALPGDSDAADPVWGSEGAQAAPLTNDG